MASKPKGEYPASELVQKDLPCEDCGSSDALALYSDDHTHCFSCGATHGGGSGSSEAANAGLSSHPAATSEEVHEAINSATPLLIKSRGLTQATCREWDYLTRQTPKGDWEQLAVYRDPRGQPVGIKVRNIGPEGKDKHFYAIGSVTGDNLFGRSKWASGGKVLVITEGEVDCLTVSQAYHHKYPVVSVPTGAKGAAKAVAANLQFINSFDKVVIGFDMDEPGRAAAEECAQLLPAGKAYIAKWDEKDANATLIEKGSERVTWAVHTAEAFRPDGILDARTLTARCLDPVVTGIPWPWRFMTAWTFGRRDGEVYTFGAGTGIGKTDTIAEIIASTISGTTKYEAKYEPEGVAIFGYEAGPATTKKAIAGKLLHRRFHIPQDDSGVSWTDAELRQAMDLMDHDCWDRGGKLFINDSFGAADWDEVCDRTRFLVRAEGIKHLVVDPISALVTGEEDERKLLDKLVLEASQLAQELRIKVYLLSHLTRPSLGPSHEEGGHVRLNQFRGSNGIGMFSHFVFGQERNQQAEDPIDRVKTTYRSVKDRYTGNSLGKTHTLIYDVLAGTLDEPVATFMADPADTDESAHGQSAA